MQQHIEHRGKEKPEERHAQHAGENRHTHRMPHLGACPGGENQRHHAHDEGERRHQDRAQPDARRLQRGANRIVRRLPGGRDVPGMLYVTG